MNDLNSPMVFDSFDDHLIELVKQHEFLYNPNKGGFKNLAAKEQKFQEIAALLGRNTADVKLRWKTLRERFSREKKRVETESQPNEIWFLYNSLTFLSPFVKSRKCKRISLVEDKPVEDSQDGGPFQLAFANDASEIYITDEDLNLISESDKRLVELVKSHDVVYNRIHSIPQRNKLKALAWRQIAKVMNIDPPKCRDRWNILRNHYIREYRRIEALENNSSSYNLPTKTWPLYDSMSFLQEHVLPKRPKTDGKYYGMDEGSVIVNNYCEETTMDGCVDDNNLIDEDQDIKEHFASLHNSDSYFLEARDDFVIENQHLNPCGIDDRMDNQELQQQQIFPPIAQKYDNIEIAKSPQTISNNNNNNNTNNNSNDNNYINQNTNFSNNSNSNSNNNNNINCFNNDNNNDSSETSSFLSIIEIKLNTLKLVNKNRAMEDILQYCNALQNYELNENNAKMPVVVLACQNCDMRNQLNPSVICRNTNNLSRN